jgi:hypothetical protein
MGIASTGSLQTKLAKLLSRGQSQKSSSTIPVASKTLEDSLIQQRDDLDGMAFVTHQSSRSGQPNAAVRSRSSIDTLGSHSAGPSRQASPFAPLRALPEVPLVQPLALSSGDTPDQDGAGFPSDAEGEVDLDKADWEGDLSDDDDDYGEPVRRAWDDSGSHDSWSHHPQGSRDLGSGTWVMNSHGWKPTTSPICPEDDALDPMREIDGTGDLQIDIGSATLDSRFAVADVPATIPEAELETDATSDGQTHSFLAFKEQNPQADMMSTSPNPRGLPDLGYTRKVPASPSRVTQTRQRSQDRSWISPISKSGIFDDAEEDDEDEGLEIDVGLKRGRRASKPLTPVIGRHTSLPPI